MYRQAQRRAPTDRVTFREGKRAGRLQYVIYVLLRYVVSLGQLGDPTKQSFSGSDSEAPGTVYRYVLDGSPLLLACGQRLGFRSTYDLVLDFIDMGFAR